MSEGLKPHVGSGGSANLMFTLAAGAAVGLFVPVVIVTIRSLRRSNSGGDEKDENGCEDDEKEDDQAQVCDSETDESQGDTEVPVERYLLFYGPELQPSLQRNNLDITKKK